MQNFIFISPNFPTNYWQFCRELKNNGMNVLGIGDQPYDELKPELKESLNEYYKVGSLENYDEVYRAVAFFAFKYGRIDWLESNNEYWLERDAALRTDFHITSGFQTEDMPPEMTREFVTDIEREADRLSRITEDLLRLTRLDSGHVDKTYPVAVAPVLGRVLRMLKLVARERQIRLTCEADERAVVLATGDDIHQVLYNLIENGIKYSREEGYVRTTVCVEGESVVIRVEDNGIGVPQEDLAHIFERFYRVDKARSREIGGTGLGLSIVSDTVRRRGGTITAAQREGGGTVFTVRFKKVSGVTA